MSKVEVKLLEMNIHTPYREAVGIAGTKPVRYADNHELTLKVMLPSGKENMSAIRTILEEASATGNLTLSTNETPAVEVHNEVNEIAVKEGVAVADDYKEVW